MSRLLRGPRSAGAQPASRLPPQPGERIDRSKVLTFTFAGKPVSAHEGDTIASALFAGGRRTFSRSFKYHRPRGLLCCAGQCPNCLVQVGDSPGVRACTEPVTEGLEVRHINATPSLDRDVMQVTDKLGGPFTPPGFYYKTFIRPRRAWPLYEKVLRSVAGLGKLGGPRPHREWRTDYRRRHADVLVIGGGPAGLAAAARAAELGADVVLVDEGSEPGGHLLAEGGYERARELVGRVRELGVELLAPAAALGFFDGMVPVWAGDTLHQIRAKRHVAATGTIEQPLVFTGNDLPGVMLSGGARRLASLYALLPGETAVVATCDDRGIEAALALRGVGVRIAAVADLRESADTPAVRALREAGVEHLPGATVIEAKGGNAVQAAVLAAVDASGTPRAGTQREHACDLLIVSGGEVPAGSLLLQAGARAVLDTVSGRFLPGELPDDVHAAGAVASGHGASAPELSGSAAGAAAAHALGLGDEHSRAEALELESQLAKAAIPDAAPAPALAGEGKGKCFACLCEDVTAKDIAHSIAEGFDSVELSKRYTTVTMGPCQGRMCQLSSIRLLAKGTGLDLAQVGTTTARPPWSTVPMGVLAGRPFEPAKRSAVHGRHRELGANVLWAGDWRRPYDYGDPEGEALAVHERAGLIDVSTLGKLILQGEEAGAFLDRLYPNRFSNLKTGRIRYGVLGSDAGRIMDDGTICRLGDDAFYVTTTSSGAEAMEAWFTWWQAEWRMDVRITDVTPALAAVNLAGPKAREIMGALTKLDCSNEAFGYLDGKRAHVAGVPALLLRIGFVGELGYEIHFPAAFGEHVWDALLEAGAPHGLRPFGLEPQRVLRLEKMHILVGQDTDSESNPYDAAMPWIVKLDKDEDFIGRWALERATEREPVGKLVGFTLPNGDVPHEGAAIVVAGGPGGRVTSSRFSRKLGHTIGMAWVPPQLAQDGESIEIADEGKRLIGRVTTSPFYDPDQERLRS
jgi:sarcosine oxidase subunit alpha